MPAAIIRGIRIEPTAAEHPAELVIEILIKKVTSTEHGISSVPARRSGLISRLMRCLSHSVAFITIAKPMTAMMASKSFVSSMAWENAFIVSIGAPPISVRISPEQKRTNRVSYRLTRQ